MPSGLFILDDDEYFVEFKLKTDMMKSILDIVADNAFRRIVMEIYQKKTYLVQGQALESSLNTLKSVIYCAQNGYFSDAFTLVRKIREDLMQYLFIIASLNNNSWMTLESEGSQESDSDDYIEKASKSLERWVSEEHKCESRKAVGLWLDNSLHKDDSKQARKDFFASSKYIAFFQKEPLNKTLFSEYLENIWDSLDRELNNYVHSNGSRYVLCNLPGYSYDHRKELLYDLACAIVDIAIIFLSMIMFVDSSYIGSSDYIDHLDVGSTPPEDCQYWIAYSIQEFINQEMKPKYAELVKCLRLNNSHSMVFD